MTKWLFLLLCVAVSPVSAQFVYNFSQEPSVSDNEQLMPNAWAGGLNASQYSTMDLNGDDLEDLVIFDRVSSKISPYINNDGQYQYAPQFEGLFPEGIRNWMLLRDFNCDGKKDIFASHPLGVVVYVNVTTEPGALQWRVFNYREDQDFKYLLTQGFSSAINLQVNAADLPAIEDIDNDGDLDILVYKFTGSSTMEFHKNLSMERDGNCDSLQFERVTQNWGNFQECRCGSFAFNGEECPPINGGREQHQAGKSILAIDVDGDNDKDLLVSEEQCANLYWLKNTGTPTEPAITEVNTFPEVNPAAMYIFPAAYYEDVDFDGVKDLLVSPNVSSNVQSTVNFRSSGWFYKNQGTTATPDFELQMKNFMQEGMIELGENAAPAFADIDADGDYDMIVGSYLNSEQLGFSTSLTLYRNTGTANMPAFTKETEDYLGYSVYSQLNVKPAFADINRDGRLDIVISGTDNSTGQTTISYILNQSEGVFDFSGQRQPLFAVSTNYPNYDNFALFDVDQDGLLDLLIGRSSGRLEYYRNTGSEDAPSFELVDQSFYGLDYNLFRQYPAPVIDDLNGDGQLDMLVGDAGGRLSLYPSFQSFLDDPQEGFSKLFRNPVNGDSLSLNLGNRIWPTTVNLFNEDKPAIVIGSGAGGLLLLRNDDTSAFPVVNGQLSVFPNPINRQQQLNIGASKPMTVNIVSLTGKTIMHSIVVPAYQFVTINIAQLRGGMYMVVGRSVDGIVAKRFVVIE